MSLIQGRIFPPRLLVPPVVCLGCKDRVQGFRNTADSYSIYPCGCVGDPQWVEAFAAEMKRRERNQKPQDVMATYQANRESRQDGIKARVTELNKLDHAAKLVGLSDGEKVRVERTHELQQLQRELRTYDPIAAKQPPPVLPVKPVTPKRMHEVLANDPEFKGQPIPVLIATADAMMKEIKAYVTDGTPVSQLTLRVAMRLSPGSEVFLPAGQTVGPVLDKNPDEEFAEALSRRKRRRIDILKELEGPSDPST